jgi:hypothetical protein
MYKALGNFLFYGNDLLFYSLQKLRKAELKYEYNTTLSRMETQGV